MVGLCVLLTLAHHTSAWLPGTFWGQIGQFGVLPATAIWEGHYAALFTTVFVHANILHIGFNMLYLLAFGAILEATLNPLQWALFFIASAVAGSGVELALTNQTGIGASGVVYAMFGLLWAGRREVPLWQLVATPKNMRIVLGWGLFCIAATWLGVLRIANGAHVGGFLFGLAVGWLFVAHRRQWLAGVLLTALILITVLSVRWMPWSGAWCEWKGNHEAAQQEYAAAIQWFQRSLRLGQDPARVWAKIAVAEQQLGNRAGVEEALREMIRAGGTIVQHGNNVLTP
jgi:GlpG protein